MVTKPASGEEHNMDREESSGTDVVETHPGAARTYLVPAVVCVAFVVLADRLFYRQPVGATIGCYGLLLMCAVLARGGRSLLVGPMLVVAAASALLFLWCFEEPGLPTVFLALLGLVSLALAAHDGWSSSAVVWYQRWVLFVALAWLSLPRDAYAWHQCKQDEARRGLLARFCRHWAVPIVISFFFLILLAAANPIISDWLSRAWSEFVDLIARFPAVERILLWMFVGIWVWALLRFRSGVEHPREDASAAPISEAFISPGLVVRCLIAFNALFAVQTVLDIRYLWGGAKLPEGMTYAHYAHRGAYPLLATALLAALFVLVTFRQGSRANGTTWPRRLVFLWLAQNVFLIVSAARRLCLYIEVYTLTRWRIAAAVWMLLVACGLVWILIRIAARRSNSWLINCNVVTALVVVYACSFVDFDGLIADFNIDYCREVRGAGPPLDLDYLEGLGPETLPALVRFSEQLKDTPRASDVHRAIGRLKLELDEDLRNWRGWTLRRRRLARLDFPKESLKPRPGPKIRNRSRIGR